MRNLILGLALFGIVNVSGIAQNYKEIKIGNSVWMAENLNIYKPGSWNYNDDTQNGVKYGRLYTWESAKNACPSNWHLPTEQEWDLLIENAGGNSKAGKLLKKGGSLGLNFILGGFSNVGGYNLLNMYGTYWTSTGYDDVHAWYIYFTSKEDLVTKTYFTKSYGLSVRCVKNK